MKPANDNRPPEFDARLIEYLPGLYSMAGKYTRNPEQRQDLVTDTIMDALTRWRSYREDGGFYNWLSWCMRGTVSNYSKMSLTTKGRAKHVSFDDIQATMIAQASQEDDAYLSQVLSKLGGIKHGDLIILSAMGHSDADIAKELGMKRSAVGMRMTRARQRFAELAA